MSEVLYTLLLLPPLMWNLETYRYMCGDAPWWERWGHALMGGGSFGSICELWWRGDLPSHSFYTLALVGLALLSVGFIFRRRHRAYRG